MKTKKSSFGRLLIFIFSIVVFLCGLYTFSYNFIYQSIDLTTAKTTVVEYGSRNTDVKKLINKVDGEIISIKNQIKTRVVGKQEIVLVVAKGNISKEIPVEVEVRDTAAPIINLVSEEIIIKQGDRIDLLSNVSSVVDEIDGNIPYVTDGSVASNYFSINGVVDCNAIGTYVISVLAVDRNGNTTTKNFSVVVKENEIANRVVSMAHTLVGRPYILGARGPYAFDCSGLIQYLYAQVGISVSRGATTQMYDGVAVSYEEMLPGDIINWGYGNGTATHSSLYIGDGLMIHAANPSQGVIISDVLAWQRGSTSKIIGIRRIK